MINDDHLYLDHLQLRARGWTRTLVETYLIKPDRWATVNYWANYKGKATYFVERVIQVESRADFRVAFQASIKRRKLTLDELADMETERTRVDDEYRAWLKTVTPEDVRRMLILNEAADVFEEARSRGYRTPHK